MPAAIRYIRFLRVLPVWAAVCACVLSASAQIITTGPRTMSRTVREVTIARVVVSARETEVRFLYTLQAGEREARFFINPAIAIYTDTRAYRFLRAKGVSLDNTASTVQTGERWYFTVYFEPLPAGATTFDIIECGEATCFNFYGVEIQNPIPLSDTMQQRYVRAVMLVKSRLEEAAAREKMALPEDFPKKAGLLLKRRHWAFSPTGNDDQDALAIAAFLGKTVFSDNDKEGKKLGLPSFYKKLFEGKPAQRQAFSDALVRDLSSLLGTGKIAQARWASNALGGEKTLAIALPLILLLCAWGLFVYALVRKGKNKALAMPIQEEAAPKIAAIAPAQEKPSVSGSIPAFGTADTPAVAPPIPENAQGPEPVPAPTPVIAPAPPPFTPASVTPAIPVLTAPLAKEAGDSFLDPLNWTLRKVAQKTKTANTSFVEKPTPKKSASAMEPPSLGGNNETGAAPAKAPLAELPNVAVSNTEIPAPPPIIPQEEAFAETIIQRLYFSIPRPEGAFLAENAKATLVPGVSLYCLEVGESGRATFAPVGDPLAVRMLLSSMDKSLAPVCDIASDGPFLPENFRVVRPGKAVLSGELWVCMAKAVVSFHA